jgi:ribonuclease HI
MYFDGSKRIQGTGTGVVLISPQGDKLKYVLRMSFPQASNSEAEYDALLHRMKMAKACGATRLKIFRDSNLIVQQVMNRCDAINDNIMAYKNLYHYLKGTFDGCKVSHVGRNNNEEADNLANIGSQCLPVPSGVFWEEIVERSIKNVKSSTTAVDSGAGAKSNGRTPEPKEVMMIEEAWMQPYLAYMMNKKLPEDGVEAKRITRRSKAFVVLQGKLYKKEQNWRSEALRNAPRRASNIKGHTCRSMWPSHQQQGNRGESISSRILLANSHRRRERYSSKV